MWFRVTHSNAQQTKPNLKAHEMTAIEEQQQMIAPYFADQESDDLAASPLEWEEIYNEPAIIASNPQTRLVETTCKSMHEDPLHQSTHRWAVALCKLAHNAYQKHPSSKHIYRVLINANMVPSILSHIPSSKPENRFEIESDLRNYYLTMLIMHKVIESGNYVNARRVISGNALKQWNIHIRQAETIQEELSERIFLLHCHLATAHNNTP